MLKPRIFKSMKSFVQRYKLLSLVFLVIIIFIPVLVFAINTSHEGYQSRANTTSLPVFAYDRQGVLNLTGYCVINHSARDYFIPTATDAEHWAFYNDATAASGQVRTDLSLIGCVGDGYCDSTAGETCNSAERACGACNTSLIGNGICDPGEECSTVPQDCGDCGGGGGYDGGPGPCIGGYYEYSGGYCSFFAS